MATQKQNLDSEPAINLAPALARLENDRELLRDLAQFYIEDVPALIQEIQKGIDHADFELITRSAHSLKGLSSNFDAYRAVAAALAIEISGRQHELQEIRERLPELREETEHVMVSLNSEFLL